MYLQLEFDYGFLAVAVIAICIAAVIIRRKK